MNYSWSRLLDKRGRRVKKPVSHKGIIFDLDKNRTATLFDGLMLVATLRVLEIEAHASGISLKGVEQVAHDRVQYQEWFLGYEA